MMLPGHEACFVCRGDFAFGLPEKNDQTLQTRLIFTEAHEGWEGIPHGGAAMTLLLELAEFWSHTFRGRGLAYPLASDWRFADTVALGDEMLLKAEPAGELLRLTMRRQGGNKLYLAGDLRPVAAAAAGLRPPAPALLLNSASPHRALAVYENCFVCGRQRRGPGLKRRFFASRTGVDAIIVRFGGAADAETAAALRQSADELHPGVLAALLDELCGWSGVLAGDLYGYTVKFSLRISRRPRLGEEFFGFSPTPETRGRGSRQFYFPAGMIYRQNEDGSFEELAAANGQWLAREELRQQFYANHRPEDLSRIFF
ncbi:MAG: hypothetical protein JXR89_11620 [Deltaproteobacteria bacterium]|nr:hypothetical protein [Deltaproteobacteria bacterium]